MTKLIQGKAGENKFSIDWDGRKLIYEQPGEPRLNAELEVRYIPELRTDGYLQREEVCTYLWPEQEGKPTVRARHSHEIKEAGEKDGEGLSCSTSALYKINRRAAASIKRLEEAAGKGLSGEKRLAAVEGKEWSGDMEITLKLRQEEAWTVSILVEDEYERFEKNESGKFTKEVIEHFGKLRASITEKINEAIEDAEAAEDAEGQSTEEAE